MQVVPTGFEPMTSVMPHDAMLYHLQSYKATQFGAGHFVGLIYSLEGVDE